MKWQKDGQTVEVRGDLRGLQKVIAGLNEGNDYAVKVGILSTSRPRKGKESNASIGIVHEFGSYSKRIPERSFLRMPLNMKSREIIREVQKLGAEMVPQGNLKGMFKQIGLVAEKVIADAFATGGFGAWAALSQKTINRKKSDGILKDSGQLARSITSQVVTRNKQ